MINPISRRFKKVNRKLLRNTYENKSCKLCFAPIGIQALEKGFLTVRQIEAVRRTITGRLKRKGKVWIRAFPDYPRTAKLLFEVYSKEVEKLKEALDFASKKIPLHTQIITRDLQI